MNRPHVHPALRLATVAALSFALLAAPSAAFADGPTHLASETQASLKNGCWEAECGGAPHQIKLVDPVCYAHEGSQYLSQCQDIYP